MLLKEKKDDPIFFFFMGILFACLLEFLHDHFGLSGRDSAISLFAILIFDRIIRAYQKIRAQNLSRFI